MIRVFVGCSANGEDLESQAVLEHTLRKYASEPVEITWMRLSHEGPFSGWRTDNWSTPFSGFRWAVPELCGFEGRAIYTDSDVIWRADVAELWHQEMNGKAVLAKGGQDNWRFCVSLWDCATARRAVLPIDQLRRDPASHRTMKQRMAHPKFMGQFVGNWNCIDLEDYRDINDPDIKVIHYSDEAHQPHLKYAIPRLTAAGRRHWFEGHICQHWRAELRELFAKLLEDAISDGYSIDQYEPEIPFGPYIKASTKNYGSNRWAR